MYHPEAVAVGFQKLVAVSVQKVVASRGWWWQECYPTMAGLTVLIFSPPSRQVTIRHCHQVGFIFCLSDATATMAAVARCLFLRNTTATVAGLLFFFAPRSMWVAVAWLIVFVVSLARQQATTKNHGHCCMLPSGWLCFFLMEWHCGQVSAPCRMQFAAWPMPTVQWGKITAGYFLAIAIPSDLPMLMDYLFCGTLHHCRLIVFIYLMALLNVDCSLYVYCYL